MIEVESSRVIHYQEEIVVELQGRDERGDFGVISYQFEQGPGETVRPRESIAESHVHEIETTLAAEGYELESA